MQLYKLYFFLLFFGIFSSISAQFSYQNDLIFLTDYEEKQSSVIVIKFFATWCKPCIAEIPEYNKLVAEYEKEGALFITISDEKNAEKVTRVLSKYETKGEWALDTGRVLFKKYKVRAIPDFAVVFPNGELMMKGELSEVRTFIETGEKPDENPLFKSAEGQEMSLRFKTSDENLKPYGSSSSSTKDGMTEVKFEDYSFHYLLGSQMLQFNKPRIMTDTNDFPIDLYYRNKAEEKRSVFYRKAIDSLTEKMKFELDTIKKSAEVYGIKSMRTSPTNNYKGWLATKDSLVFEDGSIDQLQFYIETNWHKIFIGLPQSNFKVKFRIPMRETFAGLLEELEKVGFEFEKTTAEIDFLMMRFQEGKELHPLVE